MMLQDCRSRELSGSSVSLHCLAQCLAQNVGSMKIGQSILKKMMQAKLILQIRFCSLAN